MNRVQFAAMPLLAASLLVACDRQAEKAERSDANAMAANGAAAEKPDACNPGQGIRVGQAYAVKFAGNLGGTVAAKDLRWDTSGSYVTLVATGDPGSGKEVEIAVAKTGGASPPVGDCLRSGSYLRIASAKHAAPARFLQAYQGSGGSADHVTIGDYPDTSANSTFYVRKVSGPIGSIIERGDEVTIRGTQHDPWLAVGTNPVAGQAVGLVHHPESDDPQADVAKWTIGNKGEN